MTEISLSIVQDATYTDERPSYRWAYSQEGAVGHTHYGTERSVAACIEAGIGCCEAEAKRQGIDRIGLTLRMADQRIAGIETVAAGRQATVGQLADALVARLRPAMAASDLTPEQLAKLTGGRL